MKTLIHLKRYHTENGAKGIPIASPHAQSKAFNRKVRKEKPQRSQRKTGFKPRWRAQRRGHGARLDAWDRASAPATAGCVPAIQQARTFPWAGKDPPACPARRSSRVRRSEPPESAETIL